MANPSSRTPLAWLLSLGIAALVLPTFGCKSSDPGTKPTVGTAPDISTQPPASLSAASGENVTISVAATGTTLSYEWQRSDDNGATWQLAEAAARAGSPSYTVTTLPNLHRAQFRARIFNKLGSMFSSPSTLNVSSDTSTRTTVAQAPGSAPLGITTGPDGHIWFTNSASAEIGKLNTVTRRILSLKLDSGSQPTGITSGPDGKLWFTQAGNGKVGVVNVDGTLAANHAVGAGNSQPTGITAGPDGNIWFTLKAANKVGCVSPGGVIRTWAVPTADAQPMGITKEPKGYLWFTESNAGRIGRIKPDGTINEWDVPAPATLRGGATPRPEGIIAVGGEIWFADRANNRICRFNPDSPTKDGLFRDMPELAELDSVALGAGADPAGLATDANGNVYITDVAQGKLAKVPNGSTTPVDVPLPANDGQPSGIAIGPDGQVWVTEKAADQITQVVTTQTSVTDTAVTVGIEPAALTIFSGQTHLFKWSVKGIPDESVIWSTDGGTITDGVYTAPDVATDTTYHVVVKSTVDQTKSATATITVKPAPALPSISSFTSLPSAGIHPGQTASLIATFTNGKGFISPAVGDVTSGAYASVGPLSATTTYTLTVTNDIGRTATATRTVLVDPNPGAVIATFSASPTEDYPGRPFTLNYQWEGISAVISWSGGTPVTLAAKSGTLTVNPAESTTYTLTVQGGLGTTATQTASVTVLPAPGAPVINELFVSQTEICTGEEVIINAIFEGGTGVITPTIGQVASGEHKFDHPTVTTTYTLTVTGPTGLTSTRQVTVTVDPKPRASISSFTVNPTTMSTPGNALLAFNWQGDTASINNGVGAVAQKSGTMSVSVPYSTTYKLTVLGGLGSVATAEATVMFPVVPTNDSISGTVSYSGGMTGRIYVYLQPYMGGYNPVAGTTIDGPGPFVIRGVKAPEPGQPDIQYFLMARMDNLDTGVANVVNPWGETIISVGSASLPMTGQVVTLNSGGTSPELLDAPGHLSVSPMDQGAMVFWETLEQDMFGKGVEAADKYIVEYSSSSDFVSLSGSKEILAHDDGHCFLTGLTNGTQLYFRVKGMAGANSSPYSSVTGPVTIGAVTGEYTVSGTVTFDTPLTERLNVLVMNESNNIARVVSIANPVSPQAFAITGVPAGGYQVIVMVDKNGNGIKDIGDPFMDGESGAPTIAVSGDVNVGSIALSMVNAIPTISTTHMLHPGDSHSYGMNVEVMGVLKLPVAMTVLSGPDVTSPIDIPKGNWEGFSYWVNKGSTAPVVNDAYLAEIRYSDGTVERSEAKVTTVLNTFANNMVLSGTSMPIFNWTAPSPAPAIFGYELAVDSIPATPGMPSSRIWEYPKDGMLPSDTIQFTYNGAALTTGTYQWSVTVKDAKGNKAVKFMQHIVP